MAKQEGNHKQDKQISLNSATRANDVHTLLSVQCIPQIYPD